MKYPISHTKNAGNFSRAVFCAGLIIAQTIIAQTPAPSLVGDGSEGDPYLIETIENLHWIAADTTIRDKHFRQTAHIDASVTVSWFSGLGWLPIGHHINNPFNGTYDGNGFAITGLTINRPSFDLQGLFGIADNGSVIKNVGLVDVSITGSSMVGALVGNNHGQIVSCYSTGTVSGHIDETGGLVGRNNTGTIEKSYSTATVSGQNRVGGFAGLNNSGIIAGCYSAGPVLGETLTEAFLGENYMGDVNDCYYSQETSGGLNSVFAQALASTQMTDSLSFPGWDFTTVWNIDQGISYPYLLDNAQTPPPAPPQPPIISIGTLEELQNIGNENFPLNGHYQLTGNIDASPTSEWNGGAGFIPIGGTSGPFTGIFDGNGYVISGLHINRNTSNQTGLFKNVHEAYIENLGLRDVNITGADNTGGLAGSVEYAHISNCFVTGVVKGGSSTGGLIGSSYGVLIAQSYTAGSVTGTTGVGGLAGYSSMSSNVQNCYSTADVTGDYNVGGLVGYVYSTYVNSCYSAGRIIPSADQNIGGLLGSSISAEIVNCFWDVTASGIDTSAGGSPKTSLEMFYATTFTEWDFVNVWSINEAVSYPFLTANAQTPAPAPPVPTYHTVAFNSNDGTPVDTQHIQDEHLAQLPPDPEKAGLRFIGWYSDVALESEWDFPFRTVIEDITLYARWDEPLGEGLVSSGAWSAYADSYGSELDTVEGILDNGIARMGYSIIEDPNSELSPWAQMSVRYNETLFLGLTAVEVEYRAVNDFEMLVDQSGLSQTGDNHKLLLTRSNLWKTVILPLDSFGQAAWVTEPVALDPGTIAGFSFIPMASLSEPTVGAVEIRRLAFHIETHAVMFQFNDGRPVHSEQVPSGALIPVPDDPKRAGYEFGGWYSDQGFMNWWNFTLDVVTADTTLYAKWEPEQIVVHFDPQGGSRPDSITVTVDNPYGTLPQTERQGYAFMGWFTDPYGEGELVTSESIVEIADNHTLYALYETVEYTITYVLDGGVNREENPPLYTIESPEILFRDPYKEGYIFQGWYGDREYEQPVTAIPSGSFSEVTVWAKWAPDQIVVHFDPQGGSRPDSITVTVDNPYGTLPQTERQGYAFMGWFTDPHGEGEQVTSESVVEIADNHTLYALYERVEYTITYVLDGGVNSEDNPPLYTIESPEIIFSDPYKEGYIFQGWYGDREYEQPVTAIPSGSFSKVTVWAKWAPDQIVVHFDAQGGSRPDSITVTVDNPYGTLPQTERQGYSFMGWFTDPHGEGEQVTSERTVEIADNHTLYALYEAVEYTITYVLDGGVNSEDNPPFYTIESPEILLRAPSKVGFGFDGWYGDGDHEISITAIPAGSFGEVTVHARWLVDQVTVAYDFAGGEVSEVTYKSVAPGYEYGELPATKRMGYEFMGWFTEREGKGEEIISQSIVTVKAEHQLYAFWIPVNYPIVYNLDGGVNSEENPLYYTIETEVVFSEPQKEGYLFDGWYRDLDLIDTIAKIDSATTGRIQVFAKWLPAVLTLAYSAGENGSLTGEPLQSIPNGGDGTAVEAVADEGYAFIGWSDGVDDNPRIDTNATSDIAVQANFMIKKFRVNFTFEGEGATNPDGEVLNVEYGADITLYLTPRVGWYLMGVTLHRAGADGENLIHNWSASENAMKPDSVVVENITSDCRVHTVFLPIIYTLSYNPGENGTLVGDHFQSLQHGSSGTAVTAVPEQGYVFRSWSDGVQTKTRTDRDVTQSIEVTAQMKAEPAPVRDISVNQTAVDRVVITWNAPDKASPGTEYKIYRVVSDELFFTENKRLDMWELRGQLDQRWLTVFSSDDTVFTDTAVEEATGYIYLVTWTDEEGFESRAVLPITSSVTEYEVNNFSATLVIEKETWQMIAPWGESTLEFGDDTTIVVFGWDERRTEDKLHSHYVRHTEMVPGRGYWVYSEADTILSLPSVSIGKLNDSKDTLGVRLTSKNTGWNQIASPFPYTIRPQWMQTKTVWEWLPKTGGYRIAAVLEPWKAYWVHTEEDTTVKYYPLLSGPVLAKRNSRHIGWDLQVVLGGDGVHDPDNYIGVVSGLAKRGALDEPQPPPPFGSPYLYIIGDCEKRGTRRLSHLYKMAGTNETLEWKIGVAPSKQDLSVTIERIESVPEELYLFWVDKNSAVNLRETAEINIKASAEETGGLIVATHDIKDIENYFAKFGLRPGFPNPFISAITIDFVIPYLWTGPNAHHLDVSVYDIQGRLVRNLMNTAAPAGRYSVIWDATSDNRKEVSSGMYIVRVKYADMAKSVRVMRMR